MLASTATVQPSWSTVAEVTGLRLANLVSHPIRDRADSGKSACNRAAMAELVSMIQSTVPLAIRSTTASGSDSESALR